MDNDDTDEVPPLPPGTMARRRAVIRDAFKIVGHVPTADTETMLEDIRQDRTRDFDNPEDAIRWLFSRDQD